MFLFQPLGKTGIRVHIHHRNYKQFNYTIRKRIFFFICSANISFNIFSYWTKSIFIIFIKNELYIFANVCTGLNNINFSTFCGQKLHPPIERPQRINLFNFNPLMFHSTILHYHVPILVPQSKCFQMIHLSNLSYKPYNTYSKMGCSYTKQVCHNLLREAILKVDWLAYYMTIAKGS